MKSTLRRPKQLFHFQRVVEPLKDLRLTDEDFLGQLRGAPPPEYKQFLGYHSPEELRSLLDRFGIAASLAERGFPELTLSLQLDDLQVHHLEIYGGEPGPESLLVEIRVREGKFVPRRRFLHSFLLENPLEMYLIEWLCLQDPRGVFTEARPRLPEQRYPGLGLLSHFLLLLEYLGCRALKDGFLDVPEHYHGALMYAPAFRFFNPEQEGILLALQRDLTPLPLALASWSVLLECVRERASGKIFTWTPEEQIYPTSASMQKYFAAPDYAALRDQSLNRHSFFLDEELWRKQRKEIAKL